MSEQVYPDGLADGREMLCGHCERGEEAVDLPWCLRGRITTDFFCSIVCLQHYLVDHADDLAELEANEEAAGVREHRGDEVTAE